MIRAHDWSRTPLGAPEAWPQSLRTALDICLNSAFPSYLWWGKELIQFYNDASLQILRAKHPAALGVPARDAWSEVWSTVGPLADRVLRTGEPVFGEDWAVTLERGGGRETAYFTFSYSAVRNEAGAVAGMLATAIETTEKVRAERVRRDGERQFKRLARAGGLSSDFRVLFETAPTPFLVLASPEFTIVAVNEAYLRTSMTRRESILGCSVFDVFPDDPSEQQPAGAHQLRISLGRVILTQRTDVMPVLRYPIRVPPEEGGGFVERWWSSTNTPVLGPDGRVALIIHRTQDVTDIVRLRSASEAHDQLVRDQQALIDRLRDTEASLRRSRERQEFLLRLSDALRSMEDPAEVQARACGLLGEHLHADRIFYGEIFGKDYRNVVGVDYFREGLTSLAGRYKLTDFSEAAVALRTGCLFSIPDTLSSPSLTEGARAAYESLGIRAIAAVPLVKNGKLVCTLNATSTIPRSWNDEEVALIQDVAERTWDAIERARAEEALRESEERLRRAVSVATVGVLFFDLEGRITDANEAFERLTGYSRKELRTSVPLKGLTPPEFHEITARAAEQLASSGRTTPYEKQLIRKDGSRWWGLFAPTRLTGSGPASECVEFIIDITEAKRAAEALQLADRRKDEFLATLGHELRNPLAPLRNGLEIARLISNPGLPFQRTLQMMDRQLSHLVHLVNDLLDVGRITSGKIRLNLGRVALDEVLATSTEASRVLIDAHGHELNIEPGAKGLFVNGDFDRLTQVFTNLLSNAAKYTEGHGQIWIRVARDAGHVSINIVDTGIGIPEPDLAHVFDLFSQVRVHQGRTEGGLGIGLSLVRRLVEMHLGTVSVASAGQGRGSTFTVRLPLMDATAATSADSRSKQPTPEASARCRRILVVDDNEDAAASLAILLEQLGHRVAIAHDGQEGLERAQAFAPEVIFLDLGMPRMDGFEAARRLRSLPRGQELLLVALTGWGQEQDQERTREVGFDWHLLKPLDVGALNEIMSTKRSSGVISVQRDSVLGTIPLR